MNGSKTKKIQPSKQLGFTLVELMVALVIGLLIFLGADQLYRAESKSFRQVENLSNRQAVLTFAADILVQDVRRADLNSTCFEEGSAVSLFVDGGCRDYELHKYESGEVALRTRDDAGDWQPVVDGSENINSFSIDSVEPDGLFLITLLLAVEGESIEVKVHAMNRTKAVIH